MPRNPLNPRRGIKNRATGRQNRKRSKTKHPPSHGEKLRALWQDPEYRAKMAARDKKNSERLKANPRLCSRAGIPDGMTRETVAPLWKRANELADKFIQILKETGRL